MSVERLVLPFKNPETQNQHQANLKAVERWAEEVFLFINETSEGAADSGGAGFRVVRVPN